MPALTWLTCKAFIERQPSEKQKRLLSFLPVEERELLSSLSPQSKNWVERPVHLEDALDIVHPSWILQLLQSCSSQELGFYLAALQSHQASVLKTHLHYMRPLPPLSPIGRTFLRGDLLKKIAGKDDILPIDVLPDSPMIVLAKLSFRDMIRLIYLLGLRDLGHFLRIVIDKTMLKNLENALSALDWQTAQRFAAKKDPLAAGRGGFEAWKGEPDKLRILIEQRGINRLAKALFGEHPAIIWYATHIMDAQRATFFSKLCVEVASSEVQDLLRDQVLDTLKMIPEQTEH